MAKDQGHAGHDHTAGANQKSLTIALALTSTFLVVELVGGIMAQSLALISDAAHMMTDVAALIIALMAIRIGKRPADDKRTFGYHRFEILAAAVNAIMLFVVAIYIVYEAYRRLTAPPEIQSTAMLVIAVLGLIINLISMRLLQGGQEKSLNVKGAYLEVWADMIGSVGVILGAVILKLTGWTWVDSVVAVLIGFWVVPRTWTLLKSAINILLEGVPEDVDLDAIRKDLLAIPGVVSLHDLHVWSMTTGKTTLTTHMVIASNVDAEEGILPAARQRLAAAGIYHVTIQCEVNPCGHEDGGDHFEPPSGPDAHAGHAH